MERPLSISPTATKTEKYKELFSQINSLIKDEQDLIANLSNIVAALKGVMNFFWVGFYLVKSFRDTLPAAQNPGQKL